MTVHDGEHLRRTRRSTGCPVEWTGVAGSTLEGDVDEVMVRSLLDTDVGMWEVTFDDGQVQMHRLVGERVLWQLHLRGNES